MASKNRLLGGGISAQDPAKEEAMVYEYQEYPKVLYPKDRPPVTVQNAVEEKAVMGFVTYNGERVEEPEEDRDEDPGFDRMTKAEIVEGFELDVDPDDHLKDELIEMARAKAGGDD